MTFTEIVTEIKDRLNLSSPEATLRIGRACNRKYRLVTTSIGMQLSRRATVQQAMTIGVSTLTFTNCEKVINVVNRSVSPYRVLEELTIDEFRANQPYTASDSPTCYCVVGQTADTITIEVNVIPQTAFILYADIHQSVVDLSGSGEPAFPESFHDILIEGVMSDELRKMEKAQLASIAQHEFDRILSDLRMWIAKSGYLDIYQGKTTKPLSAGGSGSGSSGSGVSGSSSYTQTGLITFDRDPSAPFAVTASSAKVDNLDADKLDGLDSTAFAQIAQLETITGLWTFSRGASAPLAIASASAPMVTNLDADKLDGFHESSFAKLADNETVTGTWTFNTPPSGINASTVLEGQVFS